MTTSIVSPRKQNMALYKYEDLIRREPVSNMMEKIANVGFMRMIIAIKGDAYTGKTTCADAIAKAYNCSVVSLDSILDSLSPSAPSSPQEADKLVDRAFGVLLRVVRRQMPMRRPVVIDSPLSKEGQLDQLLELAAEFQACEDKTCDELHCKFVIVECRPAAKYTWEQRFVSRNALVTDKWYKPTEWNDVVRGCTETVKLYPPGRLPGYVSRLIVDTTGCVPSNYDTLGPATLDLCQCSEGHMLDFRDWSPHKPCHPGFNSVESIYQYSGRTLPEQSRSGHAPAVIEAPVIDTNCGNDARHMLEELRAIDEDDDDNLGWCRACNEDISYPGPAYRCTRCGLALHKWCAELQDKAEIPDPHSNLPPLLRIQSSADEFYSSIPQGSNRLKCSSCAEFSIDCQFCMWQLHLRSRVVPTVVRHEGHHGGGHSICFWIASRAAVTPHAYQCDACKLPGYCVGYTCLRETFEFNYHVECALLPRPMSHVHGGHHHEMSLVFGTEEVKEDYMCDVCLDPILDPKAWFYSCQQCPFVSHLHCIYKTD